MAKNCNSSCSTDGCRKRRSCACMCGMLSSTSLLLKDDCVSACNLGNIEEIPKSIDEFLCNPKYGQSPDNLFNKYSLLKCGFTVEDSTQFKAKQENNKLQDTAIKLLMGVILVVLIALLFQQK